MTLRLAAPLAALLLAAAPAKALVYQTTTQENADTGAGIALLNAEAKLTINLSNSTTVGCSGSLLAGGLYMITAAHCVTGDTGGLTATSISVDFANTGLTLTPASYIVDPAWTGNVNNGGDLAILSFASAITSITGYTLDTASSVPTASVVLTGYGDTGTGTAGYVGGTFGTLHYGSNDYLGTFSNLSSVYALGFASTGPQTTMIAPGDSGGGTLADINGTYELVGVHDFIACETNGCTPNSTFGQYGGDTSVYANASFIESVIDAPEPPSATLLALFLPLLTLAKRPRKSPRSS